MRKICAPEPEIHHKLHVTKLPESDELEWEIEHDFWLCERVERYLGMEQRDTRWECEIAYEIDNGGLDLDELGITEPGVYLIVHWVEKHRGPDWTEYSSGITVVEPWEVGYEGA